MSTKLAVIDTESRRFTGFKDKHGVEIYEGDLVVTRERDPWFREFVYKFGRLVSEHSEFQGEFNDWCEKFGRYGREDGRAWLGIVEEDTAIRVNGSQSDGPYWAFRSINMGATIWDYWADQLEVVTLPALSAKAVEGE